MDHERVFITYVLRNNLARDAIERHIDTSLFSVNDINIRVWDYIRTFFLKYQTTPSIDIIKSEFPTWTVETAEVTFDWLCDKLQERNVFNTINSGMAKVANSQANNTPYKSLELLDELLQHLSEAARRSKDVSLTESIDERIANYIAVRDRHGLVGIPCYWSTLTEITGGMAPGQFWLIAARLGVGKSFVELILGYYAHKLGYKVLIFSREMSYREIFERIDAIYAGVPFYDLRKGQLSSYLEEKYFNKLNELRKSTSELWVISDDDSGGISGIDAKIAHYHPDIVFIDGLYLVKDDSGGRGRVEQLANVSRSTKILARKYNIPIVASSQLNREATNEKTKGDNVSHIAWGDALGQDADVVIELFQNKAMRDIKPQRLSAFLTKFRQGGGAQWKKTLNWDMENMVFNELLDEEDLDNAPVRPAVSRDLL